MTLTTQPLSGEHLKRLRVLTRPDPLDGAKNYITTTLLENYGGLSNIFTLLVVSSNVQFGESLKRWPPCTSPEEDGRNFT
jgi:hypothetical protein